MPLSGHIAVDAEFIDSSQSGVSKNTRRLFIKRSDSYDTGKVAVISGTCGTALTLITIGSVPYVNSSGSPVSFASVSQFVFSASPNGVVSLTVGGAVGYSRNGQVVVASNPLTSQNFRVSCFGTVTAATYTLMLYGQ